MGDLLYSFTEWLRSTWLTDFALWISETSLTGWVGMTHVGDVPVIAMLQTVHILAIAASFASVLMINARIFGIAGHATLAETSRRYTKVLWWSLVVLVLSGLGLVIGEPIRELINPYFWIKMVLVVVGVLVAVTFAKALGRQAAAADVVASGTKTTAVLLVVLWCMIMWCGRWIAYAPV